MGLGKIGKKLKKKLKKAAKKVGKLQSAPLKLAGKAAKKAGFKDVGSLIEGQGDLVQGKVSKYIKKVKKHAPGALKQYAGVATGGLAGGGSIGVQGGFGDFLGGAGDLAKTIGGYADQAQDIIGQFGDLFGGGGSQSGGPPPDVLPDDGGGPMGEQAPSMMPYVLIGAGVLVVVLLARR